MYFYLPKESDDSEIRKILQEITTKHIRYGFKKAFQKIKKLGYKWNHKKVYRVYCEMRLNMKKKPKKRFAPREKIELVQPAQQNVTWSLDYMSDSTSAGKRFRTANIIDDYNRECLCVFPSFSIPAILVVDLLEKIASIRGYPLNLRMDNGPENISKPVANWARENKVTLLFIQPGKPAQNGFIERFNRTYREEILDIYIFKNLKEVQEVTRQWIQDYNNHRPHESLDNKSPAEFVGKNSTFELY